MTAQLDQEGVATGQQHGIDIALFGAFPAEGGVPRHLANVIKVWVGLGLSVQIISYRGGTCFYPDEIGHMVSFVDLGTRSKWTTLPALWWHLRRVRPKVIMSTAHLANIIVARMRSLPSLETIGLSGVPVHRIYNGVVTPRHRELGDEGVDHPWLCNDTDIPVVLTAGRLAPQKDQSRLVDAVARLRRERSVRLIILGDGPLRQALQERADDYGDGEAWLSMPGFVGNPYAWMAKADVFVLCSLWEGFGNVLAEALALDVPVVATDCPSGPAEIIDGGRYGHLVPPADTEALTQAIRRALDGDHPVFDSDEAVSEFTAQTSARRHLEIFELPPGARGAGR
ncbi:glycosyltransferase [Aquisalimonas sp.]|uniref:glycosyltransferase n=1 Tax=Aquisalimonas sp. TaxID=1872621 RepID=UPI0025BDCA58|nr:glycosyltransferase [Aquisalimonas sp.]